MIHASRIILRIPILIIILLILSSSTNRNSQSKMAFNKASIKMGNLAKTPREIRFSNDNPIPISSFWSAFTAQFKISKENEFKSFKTFSDKLGQTHTRYKQYYKGLEVADLQYIVHEKNGLVHLANGKIIAGLNLNTTPSITEAQALQKALSQLDAQKYMWEDKKNEAFKKDLNQNPDATYYPKGRLMISSVGNKANNDNYHLVYRFDIWSEKPSFRYYVDVNAHSGKILNKTSLIHNRDVPGEGQSMYNGIVQLTVSDSDYPAALLPESYWHLDSWNAHNGAGLSFWVANPWFGNQGGYDNGWYDVLDTDSIFLSGDSLQLSFYHRYYVQTISGAVEPYNGWDGMNIRISTNGGESWQVLTNPSSPYTASSLASFGAEHAEGPGVPGWAGLLSEWSNVTFDLSSYKDQTIMIRFAFASDLDFSSIEGEEELFGWQVDDITITNSESNLYFNEGDTSTVSYTNLVNEATDTEGNYRLRESGRANGIYTYDALNSTSFRNSVDITDNDSSFTNFNARAGVSVHWSLERTYDYFLSTFNRDSYDDNGSRIRAYVHWGTNWINAQWVGNFMRYGDGDGFNVRPLVSIEVVGHEYAHGVTMNSAGLLYRDEYGALNESFSDIFGESIEKYVKGEVDWLVGSDVVLTIPANRSMRDPKARLNPDTYQGEYWFDPTNIDFDFGGVHINSGVQNHWFYLLVEGGSAENDNGFEYNVTGIGFEDAEQIAYRNLNVYLTPTSKYIDARHGSINAAVDLFSESSVQVQSVKDAWNAVGVGEFSVLNSRIATVSKNGNYYLAGEGNLSIVSEVNNPNNTNLEVKTIIESWNKAFADTIPMFDDGNHEDGLAEDGLYGSQWPVSNNPDFFNVYVIASNSESGYYSKTKIPLYFTTVGPVTFGDFEIISADTIPNPGDNLRFNYSIYNAGTDTVFNITSKSTSLDTCALTIAFRDPEYGDIGPGASSLSSRPTSIKFDESCSEGVDLPFLFEVFSEGQLLWVDIFNIYVDSTVTAISGEPLQPLKYSLNQNFPNPFNSSTKISYQLKKNSKVKLTIYDVAGRKVKTLVNKRQAAGKHLVSFEASNMPSGVYFYKIKMGTFEQSKKMLLIK